MSRQSMSESMNRLMEHESFESPYQQFQQEYPELDEYGRDVMSGRRFQQTISEFDQLGRSAMSGDPQAGEEFIGQFGFGAMAKPVRSFKDIMADFSDEASLPEVFKRQSSAGQPDPTGNWMPDMLKQQSGDGIPSFDDIMRDLGDEVLPETFKRQSGLADQDFFINDTSLSEMLKRQSD